MTPDETQRLRQVALIDPLIAQVLVLTGQPQEQDRSSDVHLLISLIIAMAERQAEMERLVRDYAENQRIVVHIQK